MNPEAHIHSLSPINQFEFNSSNFVIYDTHFSKIRSNTVLLSTSGFFSIGLCVCICKAFLPSPPHTESLLSSGSSTSIAVFLFLKRRFRWWQCLIKLVEFVWDYGHQWHLFFIGCCQKGLSGATSYCPGSLPMVTRSKWHVCHIYRLMIRVIWHDIGSCAQISWPPPYSWGKPWKTSARRPSMKAVRPVIALPPR